MENKEPIFVKYDDATRKWFSKRPGAQTTVMCCEKCGLWYKPMFGHTCKAKGEKHESTKDKLDSVR